MSVLIKERGGRLLGAPPTQKTNPPPTTKCPRTTMQCVRAPRIRDTSPPKNIPRAVGPQHSIFGRPPQQHFSHLLLALLTLARRSSSLQSTCHRSQPPSCTLSSAVASASRCTSTRSPVESPSCATASTARYVSVRSLQRRAVGALTPFASLSLRTVVIYTPSHPRTRTACGTCHHLSKGHPGRLPRRHHFGTRRVRTLLVAYYPSPFLSPTTQTTTPSLPPHSSTDSRPKRLPTWPRCIPITLSWPHASPFRICTK